MTTSILYHVITLLFIGIVSALIGIAFNKLQDPGMIFNSYKRFLEYLNTHKFKSIEFKLFELKVWLKLNITFNIVKQSHLEYLILHKDKWYNNSTKSASKESKFLQCLVMPLGLCIICNTVWIGIINTIILTKEWSLMSLFDIITVALLSAGIVIYRKQ